MTNEEFEELYPRYQGFTRAFALRLADFDGDVANDYEQVGRIAVWEFDRSVVRGNEESCIKRTIRNRLLNEHRAARRSRIVIPPRSSRACKPGCTCKRHRRSASSEMAAE